MRNLFLKEVLPLMLSIIVIGLVLGLLQSEWYAKWRFIQECNHPEHVCEALWAMGRE